MTCPFFSVFNIFQTPGLTPAIMFSSFKSLTLSNWEHNFQLSMTYQLCTMQPQKRCKHLCRDFAWPRGTPQLAKCAFCKSFACPEPFDQRLWDSHLWEDEGNIAAQVSSGSFWSPQGVVVHQWSCEGFGKEANQAHDHFIYLSRLSRCHNRWWKLSCKSASTWQKKTKTSKLRQSRPFRFMMSSWNYVVLALAFPGQDGVMATSSTLAFLKGELGGSYNLSKASFKAMKCFCMSWLHPVRGCCGTAPKLDRTLMRKFSTAT